MKVQRVKQQQPEVDDQNQSQTHPFVVNHMQENAETAKLFGFRRCSLYNEIHLLVLCTFFVCNG